MKDLSPLSFLRCFALMRMTMVILLSSSCRQIPDYSKETSQLDSIRSALDSSQANFNKFFKSDSTAITAGSAEIAGSIREIKGLVYSDTLNKELAMFLYQLSEVKGSLDAVNTNARFYSQSVDTSRKQITNLTSDLQNSLIEKNKAEGYIIQEINTAKKRMDGLDRIPFQSKTDLRKLDSLKPRILVIIDSLRSR